ADKRAGRVQAPARAVQVNYLPHGLGNKRSERHVHANQQIDLDPDLCELRRGTNRSPAAARMPDEDCGFRRAAVSPFGENSLARPPPADAAAIFGPDSGSPEPVAERSERSAKYRRLASE